MKDGCGIISGDKSYASGIASSEDHHSFEELYKEYWQPLLNVAGRYLKDKVACEEMVQELFVQLHLRNFPLNIKSSIPSYLLVALRNKIFNYLRDKAVYKRHLLFSARKYPLMQNNVEQLLDLKELQERISFYITKMPAKCKEVYLLRDRRHFTVKEIAVELNRPVDTVEKQLRKATIFLRERLRVER